LEDKTGVAAPSVAAFLFWLGNSSMTDIAAYIHTCTVFMIFIAFTLLPLSPGLRYAMRPIIGVHITNSRYVSRMCRTMSIQLTAAINAEVADCNESRELGNNMQWNSMIPTREWVFTINKYLALQG